MSGFTGTLNPKDWILTVATVGAIIGYYKDTNIELEKREDAVDASTGTHGDWAFIEQNDDSVTLKFTLYRNSVSNTMLHALLMAKTTFDFTLVNTRNGSAHTAPYARVMRQPKDGDGESLEWTIVAGETKSVILGGGF
jgi:hypothetical protein